MTMDRNPATQQFEPARRASRRAAARRGSVIVFAVAFLAVLAVLAVSYVTVVRIDRRSAAAYGSRANLRQQINTVRDHIRGLLTADLFGNKIVTFDTPREEDGVPVWPAAFEDGEYLDYPGVDEPDRSGGFRFTFDDPRSMNANGDHQPVNDAKLVQDSQFRFERGRVDDPWLADLEPVNTRNVEGEGDEWDTWPAITNLLGAYRWNQRERAWVRGFGTYADLGQFLIQAVRPEQGGTSLRGNPEARLWADRSGDDLFIDPTVQDAAPGALIDDENGPALGVNQTIVHRQMNELQEEYYPAPNEAPNPPTDEVWPLEPADSRFWADTDGDGRPDARWQEIPALGRLFGMRWVVAARIVDNSAMANVNAHLTFGLEFQPETIGDGRTPADVDLWRLLRRALDHPDVDANPGMNVNRLERWAFSQHFGADEGVDLTPDTGLQLGNTLKQLVDYSDSTRSEPQPFLLTPIIPGWDDPPSIASRPPAYGTGPGFTRPLEIKRWEREAFWRFFGSAPREPDARGSQAIAYPLGDEVDLRAFHGFNYDRLLSKVEQSLDGPADNPPGAMPASGGDDYPSSESLGPVRSKEASGRVNGPRTFERLAPSPEGFPDTSLDAGQPYTQRDKLERLRADIRRLLTTVSGSGSVGPIPVLNPAPQFDGRYATEKVRPNQLISQTGAALFAGGAPDPGDVVRAAFDAFVWALAPLATDQPVAPPLSFADVLQTASEYHYGGGADGPATALESVFGESLGAGYAFWRAGALAVNLADAIDDEPAGGGTGSRERPTVARFLPDVAPTSALPQGLIVLDSRFPHGDINVAGGGPQARDVLPTRFFGAPAEGVTFVGLDRQPFFKSVFSAAVYSVASEDGAVDAPPLGEVTPGETSEQVGGLIAVELGNPWPEAIDLRDYVIVVPLGGGSNLTFAPSGGARLGPNGSLVLVYSWPATGENLNWDNVFNRWEMSPTAPVAAMTLPGAPANPVFFDLGQNTVDLPVQLFHTGAGTADPVLVDRISPPQGEPFPACSRIPLISPTISAPIPAGRRPQAALS